MALKRTPLQRKTPLKRGGSLKRTAMKANSSKQDKPRKALQQTSAKQRAKQKRYAEGRPGHPVRCAFPLLPACQNIGHDSHHVWAKGTNPDLADDPANRVMLCREHHDWVDQNSDDAKALGLKSSDSYESRNSSPMDREIRRAARLAQQHS